MEYKFKLIVAESDDVFNDLCNDAYKEGWRPHFSPNMQLVVFEGDTMTWYAQQWSKEIKK